MDVKREISMAFDFQTRNVCPAYGMRILQGNLILLQTHPTQKPLLPKNLIAHARPPLNYSMGQTKRLHLQQHHSSPTQKSPYHPPQTLGRKYCPPQLKLNHLAALALTQR